MKYIAQRDRVSCGPIALKNAYMYKYQTPLKVSLKKLRQVSKTRLPIGTEGKNLTNV